MYGSVNSGKKISESRKRLNILYDKIPSTKGCIENNAKGSGGCESWCCKHQTPQVLYSEFLNTWNNISKKWNDNSMELFIERCLRKYLFPDKDKSCVFINMLTNMCDQHETRPFNCRIYGITPKEEFQPRYERLKIIYPDARNQCNLVTTSDNSVVTTEDTDKWWMELKSIEMSIGIKKELITDNVEGSYRTYHDHVLIHILGEKGMESLSALRQKGSSNEKEHTIVNIISALKKFKETANDKAKKNDPSSKS